MSEPLVTLDQVDETSIKELIDTDPRKLSDKDLRTVVGYLRVNRDEWAKAESEAKATGGRTKKPKINLSTVDLNIEVDL